MHALSRLLPVVLAAALLAACATLPKHEIATTDVGSMRLEQVRVTFPENAKIAWPQAGEVLEKEEKAGRPPPPDHLGTFQSYAEHRLAAALDDEARKSLSRLMQGNRPVRLDIDVRFLSIPDVAARTAHVVASAAVGVLLFGPAGTAMANPKGIDMAGSVALVDVKTGATLARYEKVLASVESAQFAREPVDSIATAFVIQVYKWLKQDEWADQFANPSGARS